MNEELKKIFIKQMLLPKEELAMQTMELLADKMNLQSKIDKAIEYINEEYDVEPKELYGLVSADELLKILKEAE